MTVKNDPQYANALRNRIVLLIDLSGLEIAGFSEFTGVSESHLYAIINGRKVLTGVTAEKIANSFGLKGWQLVKLDYRLSNKIRKSKLLNKFYDENKNVTSFFTKNKESSKASFFFESILIKKTTLFNKPVSVSQVKSKCNEFGKTFSSKQISQTLNYFVALGKLENYKRPMTLKTGQQGKREVYVFFKPLAKS